MQPELKMRVFTVVRRYRCANLLPLTVLKSAAPPPASIAPSSVPPFFWSSICYTVLDRSPWCPVPPLIATILFLFSSLSGIQLGYAQLTIQSFTRFKDVAPFICLVVDSVAFPLQWMFPPSDTCSQPPILKILIPGNPR